MGTPITVSRYVPIELVFSGTGENRATSTPDRIGNYELAPLVNIEPYNEAIQCVQTGKPVPEAFHKFEAARQSDDNHHPRLQERNLRLKLSRIAGWFWRATPTVYDISNDRLLVNDGLLDACIARFRHEDWIKVSMQDDVAKRWDARSTQELDEVCRKQDRDQIYTPIMHPAYRKYRYSRLGRARLEMIRGYLGPQLQGSTLLDIGCNCGYYLFHFRRQGMDVTGIDIDSDHLAIAAAQMPMYDLDVDIRNISLKEFSPCAPFDVVLSLSVFWHILGWGNIPAAMSERELTSKIESIVGKYLFWESGPDPDKEIDLICAETGLNTFHKLGMTAATGINERVFGVFERNGK